MNKTIYTVSILAASLLAVSSCQVDDEYMQQEPLTTVIKATAERVGDALTRTQMAYGYDVLWSEGDKICVRNNATSATFTLEDGAGTADGTFSCATSPFTSGTQVEAFYPQSLVGDGSLVWPLNQDKNFVMPMYCKRTLAAGSSQNLRFKGLGGVLQIVFMKGMQIYPVIKTVKVEDGSKTLSGAFTVDSEGKAVITATDKAGIKLETGMEKELGWGAGIINVVLPAGTYNSLKLTFTDHEGRELVRNVSESVTVSHNGITKLIVMGDRFKDVSPSTGYATAYIDGQYVDVPWVRLWWKGPKFAAYNVGATNKGDCGGYYNWGSKVNRLDDETSSDKNNDKEALTGSDDTATALWGSNWRMPTKEEFERLVEYCDRSWAHISNIYGMQFRGRAEEYADNTLFFPAAGYVVSYTWATIGVDYSPKEVNSEGIYWTSDVSEGDSTNWATCCKITDNDAEVKSWVRGYGISVRAVLNE